MPRFAGQPAIRRGGAAIAPTFEPWTDDNGNFRWDEGEAYDDVDGDAEHARYGWPASAAVSAMCER